MSYRLKTCLSKEEQDRYLNLLKNNRRGCHLIEKFYTTLGEDVQKEKNDNYRQKSAQICKTVSRSMDSSKSARKGLASALNSLLKDKPLLAESLK